MQCSALLTTLVVLLFFTTGILAQPLNSNSKLCNSLTINSRKYSQHKNVSQLSLELHAYVAGCEYVHGDLTIENLGTNPHTETTLGGDIRKLQTDFLDSIVEISGRLIIKMVSIEILTFKNLGVIRGVDVTYALEIQQSLYPMELRLPKLSAIAQGSVLLIGSLSAETYCYLRRQVNWRSLFQNSTSQQFVDDTVHMMINYSQNRATVLVKNSTAVEKQCSLLPKCDAKCPKEKTHGRSLCWSSGPYGCQSDNTCGVRRCSDHNICFNNNKTEECCHSLCLGGCSSAQPDSCFSCRKVSNNGKCDSQCPGYYDYHPGTGQQDTRHNNSMLKLGFNCVEKCPLPFLTSSDGKYCVTECKNLEYPENGNCIACDRKKSINCEKCELEYPMFSDDVAEKMRNNSCSIWMAFNQRSLFVDVGSHVKKLESLVTFEQLRVFYGQLTIKRAHQLTQGLRFLRNLNFVSDSLSIIILDTLYLGLANLHYTRYLLLKDISGLCRTWYPKKRLLQLQDTFKVYEMNVKFNDSRIECRNASCDPLCHDECWGPGPDMCVKCRNFKVRDRCYKSCHDADCYESKSQCLPCHPECAGGCNGPAPTDCVRCRHLKEFDTCVATCSREMRADSKGICYSISNITPNVNLVSFLAYLKSENNFFKAYFKRIYE